MVRAVSLRAVLLFQGRQCGKRTDGHFQHERAGERRGDCRAKRLPCGGRCGKRKRQSVAGSRRFFGIGVQSRGERVGMERIPGDERRRKLRASPRHLYGGSLVWRCGEGRFRAGLLCRFARICGEARREHAGVCHLLQGQRAVVRRLYGRVQVVFLRILFGGSVQFVGQYGGIRAR